MAFFRYRKFIFSFILFSLGLLLAGCDPCNPMGIREVGVYRNPEDGTIQLVAKAWNWGLCGWYYFFSSDGGFTWQIQHSIGMGSEPNIKTTRPVTDNCSKDCELMDAFDYQIHYKILSGKILERSQDGGKTWQVELEIPPWPLMERNYSKARFATMGEVPVDERGPFSVVTDPNTGNLIVAMGMEGILVRTQDNQWHWIQVGEFQKLQVSRVEMLGLINPEEWARGAILFLLLCWMSLHWSGIVPLKRGIIFLGVIGTGFILLPFIYVIAVLLIPFSSILAPDAAEWIFSEKSIVFFQWSPIFIVGFSLLLAAVRSIRIAWADHRLKIKYLLEVSGLIALCYYVSFLLWSQGFIFSEYWHATVSSLVMVVIGTILLSISLSRKRNTPGSELQEQNQAIPS
jgi:hypothetical protein